MALTKVADDLLVNPGGGGGAVDSVFGLTGAVDIDSLTEAGSPGSTDWVAVELAAGGFRKTQLQNLPGGSGGSYPSGTAAIGVSSIAAGASVEVAVTISGVEAATHGEYLIHVPGASKFLAAYGVVTASNTMTVTITNNDTSAVSGLSGNVTAKAVAIADAAGLSGTAAVPSSIPAGSSVEVVVTVTGAVSGTHEVSFIHVPSTNAKIGRYGVVTGADTATVTLTNNDTSAITGLSGNVTVNAESIS